MKIEIVNNKGDKVNVEVKPKTVKMLKDGETYLLTSLFELAENGKLTEDEIAKSPALKGMEQSEAVELVTALVKDKSSVIDIETPAAATPADDKKTVNPPKS